MAEKKRKSKAEQRKDMAKLAAVAAAGYTPGEKKMGADHAYQAWLTDPDGVRIELHEYTPDCCQKTGRTCYL